MNHASVLGNKSASVKHKRTLPSDLVHVHENTLMLTRTGHDDLTSRLKDTGTIYRCGTVHDDLGTGFRTTSDRRVRTPHVFAYLNPEHPKRESKNQIPKRDTVVFTDKVGNAVRHRALFVKHRVAGEFLLGNNPQKIAVTEHGDRVIDTPPYLHHDAHRKNCRKIELWLCGHIQNTVQLIQLL